VVQEHPDMLSLDIMKEVGRRWKNLKDRDLDYF